MDLIPVTQLDKEHLLNESKVFCMFPWLHLNATPHGDIYPCCSNDYTDPITNTDRMSLNQAINHPRMKELRLNMLEGKESNICTFCYKHEAAGPHSFRTYSIDNFANHFEEVISNTHTDGTLDNFKMRYFDIRFSNICNFKCRSCGTEFSSQWAIEDKKHWNPTGPILIHVDNNKGNVLNEILDHVDHIDLAYFAGGEPLITEEHYIILEELIRKGKTDTVLRYNTNASTINYKQYDIIDLWKRFKKVELSCSLDHYGERAELMRHGTDWGKVEANLKIFRSLECVDFQINTVFSIMNYMTLNEFYEYLHKQGLLDYQNDWHNSLYLTAHPPYYSAKALPAPMKKIAADKLMKHCTGKRSIDPIINSAVDYAAKEDTWDIVKEDFFHMTNRLDGFRQEDFFAVFPELIPLIETYR